MRWFGGLRLNGWLGARRKMAGCARWSKASRWRRPLPQLDACRRGRADAGPARLRSLPAGLAGGRPRPSCARDRRDRPRASRQSRVLVAFADGLAQFIRGRGELESQRPRARNSSNRLMPQALPFRKPRGRAFRALPLPETVAAPLPLFSSACPAWKASIESLETQEGCDWLAAVMTGTAAGRASTPPASNPSSTPTPARANWSPSRRGERCPGPEPSLNSLRP